MESETRKILGICCVALLLSGFACLVGAAYPPSKEKPVQETSKYLAFAFGKSLKCDRALYYLQFHSTKPWSVRTHILQSRGCIVYKTR